MREMSEKDLENVAGGAIDEAGLEREAEDYVRGIQRFQCISCKRENKSACQAALKQYFITSVRKGTSPMIKCGSYK